MNIEGGEYELLPILTQSKMMARIDELYVQMHAAKFATAERIKFDQIELRWLDEMQQFSTGVFMTTKGMAHFGNS